MWILENKDSRKIRLYFYYDSNVKMWALTLKQYTRNA